MSNDNWGKGESWVVTEGVSTEPKWPDEVKSIATETIITKPTGFGLDVVADWSKFETGPGSVGNTIVEIDCTSDKDTIELNGRAIKCRIVGDLAIHDSLDNPDCFCITHVPTLSDFMKAVPVDNDKEYEPYQLVDWCQKVQEQHQMFWSVLRELTPLTVRRNTDREMKAKDKIKEWCLSCPI
jgi:hypothetical protein